jgi:hypothetical protein
LNGAPLHPISASDWGLGNEAHDSAAGNSRSEGRSVLPRISMPLAPDRNVIQVDPVHDLVVVLRWLQGSALDGFLTRLGQPIET